MTIDEFQLIAKYPSTKGCTIPDDYRARSEYCGETLKAPLTELALRHGYLLNHGGTGVRDLDILCVPWKTEFSHPTILAEEIKTLTSKLVGHAIMRPGEDTLYHCAGCPNLKPHRLIWTFHLGGGPYLDVSIYEKE